MKINILEIATLEAIDTGIRVEIVCPNCKEKNWEFVSGVGEHMIDTRCHHKPFGCYQQIIGKINV